MAAVLRNESSWLPAAVLSTAVHLVLFLVLVFGINWQSRPPETVSVELWDRPPEPVVQAPPKPEPKPEPRPEPKPVPKPPPPPPKPEPVTKKPDIALEKDKKAPKKEPPKKEIAKEEPKLDLKFDPAEQLRKEMQDLQRDREKRDAMAQAKPSPPSAPPAAKVDPTYANRISAKIKGNLILPPNIVGNPEAVFDVEQLPSGEVLSAKLRTSSGNKSYDEAVERAIFKSSPLPLPDRREQFQRRLELRFRPLDR
jgi:colicin import membrane protein